MNKKIIRQRKRERQVSFNLSPFVWQIIEYIQISVIERRMSKSDLSRWIIKIVNLGRMRKNYVYDYRSADIYLGYLSDFIRKNHRFPNDSENHEMEMDV